MIDITCSLSDISVDDTLNIVILVILRMVVPNYLVDWLSAYLTL